jgi:hypothetical protein
VFSILRTVLGLILAVAAAGTFLSATRSWPDPTLLNAPVRLHVSPRYLERSARETARVAPVPAIRWDYRAWDLWLWVFVAAAAMTAATKPLGTKTGSLAAVLAAGACGAVWLLGVIPVFKGGAFLDYQFLPYWIGTSRLRFVGSMLLQVSFGVMCVSMLIAWIQAIRGAKKRGES